MASVMKDMEASSQLNGANDWHRSVKLRWIPRRSEAVKLIGSRSMRRAIAPVNFRYRMTPQFGRNLRTKSDVCK